MDPQSLQRLCYKPDGSLKTKPECRAAMIDALILGELMDLDEAENLVEKSLREWNFWGAA